MRTLLCCIGRLENRYIREFVSWYKDLGFTNICICDNNRVGEERFEDVISDYIDSGFVFIKDYRNRTKCQFDAYNDVYKVYSNQYDWIAFFDIDEFLVIKDRQSISEYLSAEGMEKYNGVLVNWLMFNDNGHVHYEDKPLNERFTECVPIATSLALYDSMTPKAILRTGVSDMEYKTNSHIPSGTFKFCDSNKNEVKKLVNGVLLYPVNVGFKTFLKHFSTKSCEEYCDKLKRGFADYTEVDLRLMYALVEKCYFGTHSKRTVEKVDMFNRELGLGDTPLKIQYHENDAMLHRQA